MRADLQRIRLPQRNLRDQQNHQAATAGMLATVTEPLFAAHYRGDIDRVIEALQQADTFTIVQCAPAVRVAIGEEFGMDYGTLTPGKLASALHKLGFDRVYDTNFAADLTIMEEGAELIKRVKEEGTLPMFTSCCPGWVKYMEDRHEDLLGHLSSCKSPSRWQVLFLRPLARRSMGSIRPASAASQSCPAPAKI